MNHEEDSPPLIAGIEAGGTKYVCAVARSPEEPLREERFPTGTPEETLDRAVQFFAKAREDFGPIRSMGIGTFGPADIHPHSPGYGSILTTPKPGWAGFNVVQALRDGLGEPVPIAFETDVNAALIGEADFGAAQNTRFPAYITVGTGIGGAFLHKGELLHGRIHSEIGHIAMPNLDQDPDAATNACPFHDSCFEGRASGPALELRWGIPANQLPEEHEAWALEAAYLAAGCVTLTATWSPDRIIIGGGVSQQAGLIEKVRNRFREQAGDYWNLPSLDEYLRTPDLGQRAGITGALTLAQRLL